MPEAQLPWPLEMVRTDVQTTEADMPRQRKHDRFAGVYFTWVIRNRDGVWWADGRSNAVNAGRHSLGTKDRTEAMQNLFRLDLTIAVQHGMAEESELVPVRGKELSLDDGRLIYEKHLERPRITGGVKPATRARYKSVLDKFFDFLHSKGIRYWNAVNEKVVERYLMHLESKKYAYGTQHFEGTSIKQTMNFFVEQKYLPADCKLVLPLDKPQGTNRYCWRPEEVQAILNYCRADVKLHWLADVLTCLAYTGMRIGEAIDLRWNDLDLEGEMIKLVDESTLSHKHTRRQVRNLKTGRNRTFPIHEALKQVFQAMARNSDGYVFHGPLGGRLKDDTVRDNLSDDVLVALADRFPTTEDEIGFAHGRLHSFRHFFCSICSNSGVPINVVMRWLGHKDAKMVMHYYHLKDDEARRQMRRIKLIGSTADASSAAG